ncbi:MAG: hypothetical protein JWR18_3514, partial [Segetibacter sp.]|nr:hypothetical protein [Segetibacter sp.]
MRKFYSFRNYTYVFPKVFLLIVAFIFFSQKTNSQVPFVLNGTAMSVGGDCYQLTPYQFNVGGSAWYPTTLDLKYDFEFKFKVNLGADPLGADGITFALQTAGTSALGTIGGGIGYQFLQPSLVVEYDTHQNKFEIAQDHISIIKDGHPTFPPDNFTYGRDLVIGKNGNIKDGKFHNTEIKWNATTQLLSVTFDDTLHISYQGDIVNLALNGNSCVYWGFTASTGSGRNIQSVCMISKSFSACPQPINVNTDVTNACFGESNGSVVINASGGTPPYSGTGTFSNLAAGTYPYTVTDANGLTKSGTYTIGQPVAPLATSETHAEVSCFNGNDGSGSVTASGGTAPYTYSWSPTGGTDASATGLAAGTYTVTVTDNNKCTTTQTVIIGQPAALSASETHVDVMCFNGNNGSGTVTASGGTAPYTYSWSPSGGTDASATGLAAGTYTVTVTDNNKCTTTQTVIIGQPAAALTASETHVDVNCFGGTTSATVNVTGGTAPYTYSWSQSAGTDASATGLAAGTYTVTVTDANKCTATQTVVITQPNAALFVSETHTNVTCFGGNNGTAAVSVSGGTGPYSYSWSPSGGTGATATGLAAGTYTVTITDKNACTATKTLTITQPYAIIITGTQTDISCYGGKTGSATVNITGGTGPYTYLWSPSGGAAATASGLAAGAYTVTVTDAKGCAATKSFTITQPSAAFNVTKETFPNQFNTGFTTSLSNKTFIGSSGTWTANSNANATIAVLQPYYSPSTSYALKIVNFKTKGRTGTGTASATSPKVNLTGACCPTDVKMKFTLWTYNCVSGDTKASLGIDFSNDNGVTWTQVWSNTSAQLFSSYGANGKTN